MEDATKTSMNRRSSGDKCRLNVAEVVNNDEAKKEEEQCDVEVWEMLTKSFRQAQFALDQNRSLIHQVNNNHRSKVPDNLAKNVSLINEINGNISKVLSIYSDLSVNFSSIVHQRKAKEALTGEEYKEEKAEN